MESVLSLHTDYLKWRTCKRSQSTEFIGFDHLDICGKVIFVQVNGLMILREKLHGLKMFGDQSCRGYEFLLSIYISINLYNFF